MKVEKAGMSRLKGWRKSADLLRRLMVRGEKKREHENRECATIASNLGKTIHLAVWTTTILPSTIIQEAKKCGSGLVFTYP